MPDGKYFYIKSKLNGLVLDIKAASRDPMAQVITWDQKPRDDCENQLWYEDHSSGTIRSKLSGLSLEVTESTNELVVNKYESGRDCQQWTISGDRIKNRKDGDKVLDIAAAKTSSGARICAWGYHGNANQLWTFEFIPAKFFYIQSEMHGKVLDIKHRSEDPGTKAIMMDREDPPLDNQLWYENKYGIICSKLHNFVLDTSDEDKVRLQPYQPGNSKQLWSFSKDRIINHTEPEMALDIKAAATKNGAKLLAYKWHGKDNQKWTLAYK